MQGDVMFSLTEPTLKEMGVPLQFAHLPAKPVANPRTRLATKPARTQSNPWLTRDPHASGEAAPQTPRAASGREPSEG